MSTKIPIMSNALIVSHTEANPLELLCFRYEQQKTLKQEQDRLYRESKREFETLEKVIKIESIKSNIKKSFNSIIDWIFDRIIKIIKK